MADSDGISYKRPPRWLRGWRLMVTLTVTAVMLVVFTLMTILLCSGDLRPVMERAKRDGLPTTWAELGLLTNPRHAAFLAQMQVLVSANKSYGNYPLWPYFGESIRAGPGYGKPGEALPEGLISVVMSRTTTEREHILQLIDEINIPFRPENITDVLESSLGASLQRKLFALGLEEFFVNPTTPYGLALLEYCRSFGPDSMFETGCRLYALDASARAFRYHLAALHGDSATITDALRIQANELPGLLVPTSRAEFILMSEIITMDPFLYARAQGMFLPAILENPLGMRVFHRLGRVTALDHVRQFAVAAAATTGSRVPDPEPIYPLRPKITPATVMDIAFYQTRLMARFLCWWLPMVRMRMLVTASALDGAAWPEDASSPAHAAVLELRDSTGQCFAVYSVGTNGVDDGGKKDDRIIHLRRSADVPMAPTYPTSLPGMPPGMPPSGLGAP